MVSAGREYLGGIILPGLRISMEAAGAEYGAAADGRDRRGPTELVGRSTIECIQSGLYFGNRAMVKEMTREIREEAFQGEPRSSSAPADSRGCLSPRICLMPCCRTWSWSASNARSRSTQAPARRGEQPTEIARLSRRAKNYRQPVW